MKIKNLMTAGLTLAAVTLLSAQSPNKLQYGFSFGGNAKVVDADASGNAYVAGTFRNNITLGSTPLVSNGEEDVFVMKVDPSGNILWAVSYGGTDVDNVADLETDNAGNVYLGGFFYGEVDFDPGTGVHNMEASVDPQPNTTDGYVLKLDRDGNFVYSGQVGGEQDDYVNGVGIEPSGIVYLTGTFAAEADLDPTTGELYFNSSGLDAFFIRLNADGSFSWAKSIGNGGTTNATAVAVDFTGTPVFTGNFEGDIDIDPGTGIKDVAAIGGTTMYLLRLNSNNGSMVWAGAFGGDGAVNVPASIYADGQNNTYLTGTFSGTGDFDFGSGQSLLSSNGEGDIFVARYQPTGALGWAKSYGGVLDDSGNSVFSVGNAVYVTGGYQDEIDFEGRYSASAGDYDLFILKLTGGAVIEWVFTNGGLTYEAGISISGNDDGNILTIGAFETEIDLDPTCAFLLLDPETTPSYILDIGTDSSDCIQILTQPADVSICAGDQVSLEVVATGNNLTYKWMIEDSDGGFQDLTDAPGSINGSGTPVLTITTDANNGEGSYRVRISSPGLDDVYSEIAFVSTGPHTPVAQDIINCGPGAVAINVSGGKDGQYRWYTVAAGGTPIPGESNHSYTTPFLNVTTTYYVSINDGTCESQRRAVTVNITKCEQAPGLKWASAWGGAGTLDDLGGIIAVKDGNLIVTGNFQGTVDFDNGPGTTSLTAAGVDGFIMKITPNGDLVWIKQIEGAGNAYMGKVLEDATGNLYIAGSFNGVNDFDPGIGTGSIAATPANLNEGFLSKYDKDGNFIWAKAMGGNNTQRQDFISDIEIDATGVYATGSFWSTFLYAGTSVGITSLGSNDVYVLKADTNGNLVWFRRIGNNYVDGNLYAESAGSIALNGNDLFLLGNPAPGTTDLDPGTGTFNISVVSNDAYVVKLDISGNFQSAFKYTSVDGSVNGNDIAIDKNGNIYTSGSFVHTADFDPGAGVNEITSTGAFDAANGYYCKHLPNGTLVWAKAFHVKNLNLVFGGSINLANNGDIFTSGYFQGSVDFDPGPLEFIMTGSSLFLNAYVVKLNNDGDFNWAVSLARIKNVSSSATGGQMIRDANGDIFMTGSIRGSVDFDPSDCLYEVVDHGGQDFYIQRLSFNAANICFDTDPVNVNTCSGSDAKFLAIAVGARGITYQWQKKNISGQFENINNGMLYSGATSSELTIKTKDAASAGVYRSIASAPNAASKTSIEATLQLNGAAPEAPTTIGASSCSSNVSLTLKALGGTDGSYRWYDVPSGGIHLGVTTDTFDTGLISAKKSYYVAITNGSCESTRTIVTAIPDAAGTAPDVVAATRCGSGSLTLTASGGADGQYRWYTTQNGGSPIAQQVNSSFTTPSLSVTTTYYVSIQITGCETPRAAVVATIENCATNQPPVIAGSNSNTGIGGSVAFNLNSLISDPDNNVDLSSLRIIAPPASGALATIDQSGILVIDYSGTSFVGIDQIVVEVCDFGGSCAQQTLTITVDGDLIIYNAVSPNGDGKNDILYISNITMEATRDNHVKIFNRWGDMVFDIENYDNATNVFSGAGNGGKELSSGTYFYRIEFKNGRKSETGYLSLRR